jgi:hypothetical protein
MKPTIGRIVHYNLSDEDKEVLRSEGMNNISDVLPAVVVNVHNEECINLKAIVDGSHPGLWRVHVPMLKEGEEVSGFSWIWPPKF